VSVLHSLTRRRGAARVLLVLVGTVALAALAAGCGSSSTSSNASPTASTGGSSAATWTSADLAKVTTDSSINAMLPTSLQSTIKCISDIPYPPWEYFDPPTSNNPAGFDYDLSQALAKKMGVTITFTKKPFDAALLAIVGNTVPMMMSGMYDSAERQKSGISFVDYTTDGTAILTLKGNPNGITNLDSLAGKAVTCERGTTQQAFLTSLNQQFQTQGKAQMSIIVVTSQPDALLKVQGNTAVADLTDYSTALDVAKKTPAFEVVPDPAAPYDPQMDGIGTNHVNTQLLSAIQKALQSLMDAGQYQQLCAAWGFKTLPSATVNAGPAYAASHAIGAASPSPSP
jgi:polar amino acid transport system substrate-binding protein